ncbi:putative uncharacterized protein DDB_G0278921 [Drosophila rhopaloa]|uniref:Uncharacterized protein n=1 Tax=Drosophila rhopaloa TaxID=1041015 RepID=A0ABM5J157_DRORH|nr:putative uncharacterized protein DDB_G0278921 [Drosophila rhopaloa]
MEETVEARWELIMEARKLPHLNMGKAAQDQARSYNLRKRDWRPKIGDLVWERKHPLSKAATGFAAKLASKYEGPFKVTSFISANGQETKKLALQVPEEPPNAQPTAAMGDYTRSRGRGRSSWLQEANQGRPGRQTSASQATNFDTDHSNNKANEGDTNNQGNDHSNNTANEGDTKNQGNNRSNNTANDGNNNNQGNDTTNNGQRSTTPHAQDNNRHKMARISLNNPEHYEPDVRATKQCTSRPQRRRNFSALLQRRSDFPAHPQRRRNFSVYPQRRSSQYAVNLLALP